MAITIYSTPTCPYCHMAKEFAKEKKIPFIEINVASDAEKAERMIEKSGQTGVPVIIIPKKMSTTQQEEVIVGFDRNRLIELLGIE